MALCFLGGINQPPRPPEQGGTPSPPLAPQAPGEAQSASPGKRSRRSAQTALPGKSHLWSSGLANWSSGLADRDSTGVVTASHVRMVLGRDRVRGRELWERTLANPPVSRSQCCVYPGRRVRNPERPSGGPG